MYRIVYKINEENVESEVQWLRSMFVFPAVDKRYNWNYHRYDHIIGMIADDSVLMTLKLRQPNISYEVYRK